MTESTHRELAAMPRPPYGMAVLVFFAVLVIYLLTIAPTTQFWDTSEYIAAAKVLGIPHPPGNPLFVLVAHVWGLLPIVEHYALRINLFSAISSALASGFLFLVAERFLRELVPEPRWARIGAAVGGILVGATSFTVWHQSVVNEKVYTLSLLSIALVLWLAVHWGDEPAGQRRDHWLVLILYLIALSATNHLMALLAIPAVVVYVEAAEAEKRFWFQLFVAGTLLAAAGGAALLLFEWMDDPGSYSYLFLAVVLLGGAVWYGFTYQTSTATRMSLALGVAGLVMVIAERAWSGQTGWLYGVAIAAAAGFLTLAWRGGHQRLVAVSIGVVAVGVSVWVVLRLRAPLYPPINEGEPTNWEALKAVLNREQYQKGPLLPRQADLAWQYANYLQYFTWQFGRDLEPAVRNFLALVFGGLGLVGAVRQWQRDRRGAVAMTALMVTVIVLLVFYLDFKYGFSIRRGENLLREVRERDYFFIASFQLWGIWVALGFGALLEGVGAAFRARFDDHSRWLVGAPLLLLALVPLWGNSRSASRAGETLPRDFAWDLLQSVEPYAILVTAGDNDTFPLWYMQEVEGIRRDVLLANTSLMNTDWHSRQLKRREVMPFDTANAIPLYQGRSWTPPTGSAVRFSYDEIDALPPVQAVRERSVFRAGTLRAVLEPQVLERADLMTLHLIQENIGKRPIYFSRTTGAYPDALGLTPYLVGHGLARKLLTEPVQPDDSIVPIRSIGLVNLPRTETLMFEVYHPEAAARERPQGWVDPPSEGILSLYALLYASYAQHLASQPPDSTVDASATRTLERLQYASQLAERMFQQTSLFRQ